MSTETATRTQRIQVALASLAWAYLASAERGDWVRASQVIHLFQQVYNEHREVVISQYAERVRAQAVQLLQPTVPGRGYTEGTRYALQAVLIQRSLDSSVVLSMPESAAGLGLWFRDNLRDLAIQNDEIWRYDELAVATTPGKVFAVLERDFGMVTGAISTSRPSVDTNLVTATMANRPDEPQTVSTPVPHVETEVVFEEGGDRQLRPTMPTWGWWALALGAAIGGGILLWGVAKR